MNKNYFSIILFLISLFILSYTIFKSEIYYDGEVRKDYNVYYFLTLFIFLISFLGLFLEKKIKIVISIFFFSIITSFYIFEVYINIKENNDKLNKRFDFFKKELKKDKEIKIIISSKNFSDKKLDIIPLGGIANSKTIYCNENGYYSIYESDRYGFNNPDSEHDSEFINYFLIGDSFVHGACVNRPNDIGSVLRTLSKKSVLNFGYGGHGPIEELGILREYLTKNTKKIIWFYYEGNDLINLENSYKNNLIKNYLNEDNYKQELKVNQNKIDEIGNEIINNYLTKKKNQLNFIKIIKLTKLRVKLIDAFKGKEKKNNEKNLDLFKQVLQKAKQYSNEHSSKFYFVYLPSHERYSVKNYTNSYKKIIKIINDLNINLIDTNKEIFLKNKDPLNLFALKKNSHYSVEGYYKIAELILEKTQ